MKAVLFFLNTCWKDVYLKLLKEIQRKKKLKPQSKTPFEDNRIVPNKYLIHFSFLKIKYSHLFHRKNIYNVPARFIIFSVSSISTIRYQQQQHQ